MIKKYKHMNYIKNILKHLSILFYFLNSIKSSYIINTNIIVSYFHTVEYQNCTFLIFLMCALRFCLTHPFRDADVLEPPKVSYGGHRLGRQTRYAGTHLRVPCGWQRVTRQDVIVSPSANGCRRRPHRIADPEPHVKLVTGPAPCITGDGTFTDPAGARHGCPSLHIQRYHFGLVITASRQDFRAAAAVVRSIHVIRRDRIIPHRTVLRDDHVIVVRVTEHAAAGGRHSRSADAGAARERDKKRNRHGFHRRTK